MPSKRGTTRAGGALLWSLAAIGIIVLWGGGWWWVKYGSQSDAPVKTKKLRVKEHEKAEGVYVHSEGTIRVVSGPVEVHIKPRSNSALDITAFANTEGWLTPAQDELRKVWRKMLAGGKFVETLGITEEQVAEARQLRLQSELLLTDADRALLAEEFHDWQRTTGGAHKDAEKALLATAKDVGARSIEGTRGALVEDVSKIRGILTAEQWNQYEELQAQK